MAAAAASWGGQLKQIPPLSSIPVDFTLAATYLAVVCGLIFSWLTAVPLPRRSVAVMALLATYALSGLVFYESTGYGDDKVARMWLVTLPAALAVVLLVRDHNVARRFFRGVIVLALVLSSWIAVAGERQHDENLGRLTTTEGATIQFGRAAGLIVVVVVAWLLCSSAISAGRLAVAAALAVFEIWVMLAIGSAGPVQALIVAGVLMLLLQLRRMTTSATARVVGLLGGVAAALVVVWPAVPLWSRQRILEFGSGDSASARSLAWEFTWANLDANPFGRGWGSWAMDATIAIGYPHNLFLEAWYEAGLLGLGALSVAVWLASRRALMLFDRNRFEATLLLGMVAYWVAAAQVSGDFNGNKLLYVSLVAALAPIRDGTNEQLVGPR